MRKRSARVGVLPCISPRKIVIIIRGYDIKAGTDEDIPCELLSAQRSDENEVASSPSFTRNIMN
jgi:hypothetical protein